MQLSYDNKGGEDNSTLNAYKHVNHQGEKKRYIYIYINIYLYFPPFSGMFNGTLILEALSKSRYSFPLKTSD